MSRALWGEAWRACRRAVVYWFVNFHGYEGVPGRGTVRVCADIISAECTRLAHTIHSTRMNWHPNWMCHAYMLGNLDILVRRAASVSCVWGVGEL